MGSGQQRQESGRPGSVLRAKRRTGLRPTEVPLRGAWGQAAVSRLGLRALAGDKEVALTEYAPAPHPAFHQGEKLGLLPPIQLCS